jgi:polyvinyl alcohol dehydrogenase (cytochrome)
MRNVSSTLLFACVALAVAPDLRAGAPDRAALYAQRCAACHDRPADRTPSTVMLQTYRTPEEIVGALTSGIMRQQAAGLTTEQIHSLAMHLTGRPPLGAQPDPLANACRDAARPIAPGNRDWNGWGRDPANTRFQPDGGLDARDVPRLKLKWAFAFPGRSAFGQPVVVGDRVFAGGIGGRVFSLDADTGCTRWAYDAGAPVRTATLVGRLPGDNFQHAAWFGDDKGILHAVDAATGTRLWTTRVDEHPVARVLGTPQLHDGRLYVPVSSGEEVAAATETYECCTFRGSIVALDPTTGRQLWKTHVVREPPQPTRRNSAGAQMHGPAGGAIFSAPTIDAQRGVLYAGTGDSYTSTYSDATNAVVALDLATGERRWVSQVLRNDAWIFGCADGPKANCPEPLGPDFDFAASPILTATADGKPIIVAGAKSGILYGLDPDATGRILWQVKLAPGSPDGGILWGPAAHDGRAYVATSDYSWPTGRGPGGVVAVDLRHGEVTWSAAAPVLPCAWGAERCSQGHLAAVTVIPGVVFSGGLDGRLRAYSAADGRVLWEFDTGRSFAAVNGGEARGGAIDYGGQVVARGMLFVHSGSMRQAGNALLAFDVDRIGTNP